MKPIGMRLVIERNTDKKFVFSVPDWISDRLGDLVLVDYDGERLTINPA